MSADLTTEMPVAPDPTGRAARASASGIVPVLHHINLKTSRLDELIDWYGKVAGMVPNFRWDGGAFLTNDAANHRIAILTFPSFEDDPDRRHHCGMHHSAFEFESLSALLDHYAALRDHGIRPAFALNHGLTTSLYYRDPDGNHVELQSDNHGDWDRSSDFIRTSPSFREDPIGPIIDPEAMYQAKEGGMADSEIARRSYEGEFAGPSDVDMGLPI